METPPAANAFSPAFLDLLPRHDATGTGAAPPALSGPWTVQRLADGGWGVVRPWDEPAAARPLAALARQDAALLLAAVASAAEARPTVRLGRRRGVHGFPLDVAGERVGHLEQAHLDLATGLALASGLARAPLALALLLGGAGGTAVRLTGEALYALVAADR